MVKVWNMNIPLRQAVEGGSEMAFWPAVAGAYFYTISEDQMELMLVIIFGLTGSLTYIFLQHLSTALKDENTSPTWHASNQKELPNSGEERAREVLKVFQQATPENDYSVGIVWVAIFVDVLGGLFNLVRIAEWILNSQNLSIAGVGIFLLPVIFFSMVVAAIIWNI